jgi:LIM homeobox protein 3/4
MYLKLLLEKYGSIYRRAKEKRLKKDAGRQRWSPYLRQLKKNGDIDSSLSDDRSEDGMTDYHG